MLGMSHVWQPGRRYQLHGNCRQARLAPLAWCVPGLAPGQPLPAMRQMRAGLPGSVFYNPHHNGESFKSSDVFHNLLSIYPVPYGE